MNPDALFNEGLRQARAGDHSAALFLLQQAAALEAGKADTYRLMGKVYLQLGTTSAAERCWRRALDINPQDSESAACLLTLRRFRRVRRVNAIFAAAAVLTAFAFMGGAFWRQTRSLERIQKAISEVQAAKAVAPLPVQQPSATTAAPALPLLPFASRYESALRAARAGDLRQARDLFERLTTEAQGKEPLGANAHFWLGRCLYELGETDQALIQFHIVLDRYPESAKRGDALLDAGRCYLKLREFEKARHMWQALIDGDFDPKLQESARKRKW